MCPFCAGVPLGELLLTFGGAVGGALALKFALEGRLLARREARGRCLTQGVLELSVYLLLAAVGVGVFHALARDFPAGSGAKLVLGCLTFGTFAGIDLALARERESFARTGRAAGPEGDAARLFPLTRKLGLVLLLAMASAAAILALAVIKNLRVFEEQLGARAA